MLNFSDVVFIFIKFIERKGTLSVSAGALCRQKYSSNDLKFIQLNNKLQRKILLFLEKIKQLGLKF
jgi:hypothetical protein